ncbi:MAG: FAD-dependent oxidoreductase [Desulfobacteraceae bacterium]|nr:FAD-dependent oxidoreductase [Desulfobacteraceae bacterium]MBC2755945.1 FAD-dependent oxidoreductase [Desulfobacteraceae bacterium]
MKLLIIGGVAGGATATARARRLNENAEIILFERGEYISFANCGLPYYIGEVIKERDSLLVTTVNDFKSRYAVDIRIFTEVTGIDRENKQVEVKNLQTGESYHESYDKIILSPGAEPFKPSIDGIHLDNIYNLRNIPDSDKIKEFVDTQKPESAVVVGGGFIGLEMAENLAIRGVRTTIVEKLDQVMPSLDFEMASFMSAHLKEKDVECILGDGIRSFSQNGSRLMVHTENGRQLECDMAILSIGVKPENRLASDAGLEIGNRGGVKVSATMQTSDPDIYAVGDAVEVTDYVTGLNTMMPLAGPANKQGRIAADNVMGRRCIFRGTLGTSVVKMFDLTVASTGCNERFLTAKEIPFLASYTHSGSHASYYPGAEMMAIKLFFSPGSGKILGAQIIGKEGVDKRIDVIATAIHGSMTVYDLEELELAYAPPYSSAKDPVNIAGFVAANILKGDVSNINWNELIDMDPDTTVFIDLRNKDELQEAGGIKGALHIPLQDLRKRLNELDTDKNYILYCAIGLRAYVGYRIMSQKGFKANNLSGGYKTFLGAKEKIMAESPNTPLWRAE